VSASDSGKRVWLITGTSQGFGLELVRAALSRGDSVVATSRHPQKVAEAFKETPDRLWAVAMDLRDSGQIQKVVNDAIARFGKIDVLINNAGHGIVGAIEEAGDEDVKSVFETNVFGLLRVTRAVLPHMRERHKGFIVNLSSIGGLTGIAGFGIYNGTKFAVEGLSEALAQEVGPLGIGVMIVEPGPFRTDFLGGSMAYSEKRLEEYEGTAGKARKYQETNNGSQPGDPVRAAEAIVGAVIGPNPPLHFLLGQSAYERALKKLNDMKSEFERWHDVTVATDFPRPE
jgi:NAD(P)-dependent dehydrogenase (short-subunit alcohol dehydrogenase family)